MQADQKTIIGGDFTAFNTVPRNHVARLNQDGSLDLTFEPGTGANGSVSAVGVYPTTGANSNNLNKVIIAGSFTAYNGALRKGIARLNPDGTLDTTFNPGDGVDFPIRTVVPMESGKVLIGGEFTMVNGVARNHLARLNDNGTLDMSFDAGTGTDGPVWSIATDDTSSAIQLNAAQSGGFEEYRTNINTGARSGTITLVFYPYCVPDDLRVYYGPTLIFDSGFTNEYRGDLFCDFYNWTGPITYVLPYGPGPYTDVTIVVNEGGGDFGTVWDLEATIENEVAGQRVLVGGEFTSVDGVPRNRHCPIEC